MSAMMSFSQDMNTLFPKQPVYPAKDYFPTEASYVWTAKLNSANRMQDWIALGKQLGYTQEYLISIFRENPADPCKQLLTCWFEKDSNTSTNTFLVNALTAIGQDSVVSKLGLKNPPPQKPPRLNLHQHIREFFWVPHVRKGLPSEIMFWYTIDRALGTSALALGRELGYTHKELNDIGFVYRNLSGGWKGQPTYYTIVSVLDKLLKNWALDSNNTLYKFLEALNNIDRGDLITEIGLDCDFDQPLRYTSINDIRRRVENSKYNFAMVKHTPACDMFKSSVNYTALDKVTDWRKLGEELGYNDQQFIRFEMTAFSTKKPVIRCMIDDWILGYEHTTVAELLRALEYCGDVDVIKAWKFDLCKD